ncbi:MAG TPA: GNAT family N-acetyltransferase [Acidimicrobiales bacterium]|nr:GNAT family N-acetyltransferase [Acidimicrobiales bacterium]
MPLLIAGRDDVSRRWLGEGSAEPAPTAVVTLAATGDVVGWVDYDTDRSWLLDGEVNLGYSVFPQHRGHGYATRAVQLLLHHLATATSYTVATLLIGAGNERSLALARRAGFPQVGDLDANPYFKRPVPPLSYTDGVVTIRPHTSDDLDAHIAAIDDEQIDWLWLPGHRESWEAMSPDEQREHQRRWLQSVIDAFGRGPKWSFAVDTVDPPQRYVAYVDCDLANDGVPAGEANISYSCAAAHRGMGYVGRAVRLITQFVRDHTGAREAHIGVDAENVGSLRVAASAGAVETERWVNERGRLMVRHVLSVRP